MKKENKLEFFFNLNDPKVTKDYIRVMNYNILAPNLFYNSVRLEEEEEEKEEIYEWSYRSNLIIKMIKNLEIDIICFEELEEEDNENFINQLKELNYNYKFKKRPKHGKEIHFEGCGIFYNINKFELIESFELEYFCKDSVIYNKDNIAIFTLLKSKIKYNNLKDNDLLLITCSHILFNDNRGDIKLAQIYQLQKSFTLIKKKYKDFNIRIIFCCDLNSTENSKIYEYLTNKSLNCEFVNIRELSGQKFIKFKKGNFNYDIYMDNKKQNLTLTESNYEQNYSWFNEIINVYPIIKKNEDKLNQNTKIKLLLEEYYNYREKLILKNDNILISSYKELIGNEPEATIYSIGLIGTIDYIFHSINNIKTKQVFEIPKILELLNNNIKLIPNEKNPSDHFPLISDLEII